MKEHPIIFQGWGVRAILEGRKTQTRRIIKPQPITEGDSGLWRLESKKPFRVGGQSVSVFRTNIEGELLAALLSFKCPHGVPGDRLWLRENLLVTMANRENDFNCYYQADNNFITNEFSEDDCMWLAEYGRWRDGTRPGDFYKIIPSIHMPRWASRIDLINKNVRVERVQDISVSDARAEGIEPITPGQLTAASLDPYIYGFHCQWDSINAKRGYGWDANPWVWVIEFERVSHE